AVGCSWPGTSPRRMSRDAAGSRVQARLRGGAEAAGPVAALQARARPRTRTNPGRAPGDTPPPRGTSVARGWQRQGTGRWRVSFRTPVQKVDGTIDDGDSIGPQRLFHCLLETRLSRGIRQSPQTTSKQVGAATVVAGIAHPSSDP